MALRFEADLEITSGGTSVHAGSEDGVLVLTCDRWRQASRLLRGGDTAVGIRPLADKLAEAGATVRLESRHGPLLTLGAGAEPTRLGRLVGLRHVRPVSALGLWRSSRGIRVTLTGVAAVAALVLASTGAARRRSLRPAVTASRRG